MARQTKSKSDVVVAATASSSSAAAVDAGAAVVKTKAPRASKPKAVAAADASSSSSDAAVAVEVVKKVAAPRKRKAAATESSAVVAATSESGAEGAVAASAPASSSGSTESAAGVQALFDEADRTFVDNIATLTSNRQKLRGLARAAQKAFKATQKQQAAMLAAQGKKKRGSRKAATNADGTAVVRRNPFPPSIISSQLADFLGVARGTLVSRAEINNQLRAYAAANGLQSVPGDKRIIVPDARLSAMLALPSDLANMTFFSMQKYLSPHIQTRNKPLEQSQIY
jgi:chromatin remodeling complex protein RSC6